LSEVTSCGNLKCKRAKVKNRIEQTNTQLCVE
jgi:hypothetical protein